MQSRQRISLFVIFTVSGFSGLIYESIWTHYLKLFLGHAAYAQTLVLAIYMGGLALGSWLCSRYSASWPKLFMGYALAEVLIGLCAIIFHPVFIAATSISYEFVLPNIGSPSFVTAYKWLLSTLLILPQTILLGMTFPLMSSAILRRDPGTPGKTLAMLYFTNSIGAAIGVLSSGYLLIRTIGLPGTIMAAGILNVIVAIAVWLLMKGSEDKPSKITTDTTRYELRANRWLTLLLVTSLLTGASSFIYETGWIRMLSLVLGTSTHAFELMLSAFILGLAFGGLWVRRIIDRLAEPRRFLAWVQIAMGLFAIATLPLYGNTFQLMEWVLSVTDRTESGYLAFTFASHGIALFIMFPAAFCAGMTLPLITYSLLESGHGERCIGAVYAWNTVGAIIGVFFAVHVGLPMLGLKNLIVFAAGVDMVVGLALLWWLRGSKAGSVRFGAMACTVAVATVLLFVPLDPYKMASGIYRGGVPMSQRLSNLVFHEDGKTSTVSVAETRLGDSYQRDIRTNGKTDAALNTGSSGGPTDDEPTMILLAALPLSMNINAKSVANIGFGSGLTTHTLLGASSLTQVDTIEIEPKMIEGARLFGPRVDRAFSDPRSKIYIDDAKTFFSSHNSRYDIIVSEPSNPWVSGVAGLFSLEFYKLAKSYLNTGGVFCQWLQVYELSPEMLVTVLKAISDTFTHYVIYAASEIDFVILASDMPLNAPDHRIFDMPSMAASLRWIDILGTQDIDLRRIGDRNVLDNLFRSFDVPANSDYYPVLDQNAERDRFLRMNSGEFLGHTVVPLPIRDMMENRKDVPAWTDVSSTANFPLSNQARTAMQTRDYFLTDSHRLDGLPSDYLTHLTHIDRVFNDCDILVDESTIASLYMVFSFIPSYLQVVETEMIFNKLEARPCAKSLPERYQRWFELFKAVGRKDAESMSRLASELLINEQGLPSGPMRYLVATGMLGSMIQGKPKDSLSLWDNYRSQLYDDAPISMTFRLLVAESEARLRQSVH